MKGKVFGAVKCCKCVLPCLNSFVVIAHILCTGGFFRMTLMYGGQEQRALQILGVDMNLLILNCSSFLESH